jgi:hypothetical protein
VTVNSHKKSLTLVYQHQTVEIELLNNPFVHKWAGHLEKMLSVFSYQEVFTGYPYFHRVNRDRVKQIAEHIKEAILQLKELNAGFPEDFELEETEKLDINLQQKLNRLHRYFTWCNRTDIGKNLFWGPDCSVTGSHDQTTLKKINQITHRINVEIHKLEAHVLTPNKIKLLRNEFTELEVAFDTHATPEISGEMRPESWRCMELEDFQYLSNDPTHDVWVTNQILGKPYHVAYYDHDDPTQWDITHPIGYSGNFAVTITGNQAHHMANPGLVEWLKSYGITPGPATCGMPLGRIVSGKEYLPQWQKNAINGIVVELR